MISFNQAQVARIRCQGIATSYFDPTPISLIALNPGLQRWAAQAYTSKAEGATVRPTPSSRCVRWLIPGFIGVE